MSISNNKEVSENTLDFEFLIIALGFTYVHPFQATEYERTEQVRYMQYSIDKTKNAKRILIVGGGALGVEVAGELATDCPDKRVTLISSTFHLLPRMSEKFSTAALNILKSKNVEVILNDRIDLKNVDNFNTTKLKTQNGKEIEFDAYFVCIGGKPCTKIVKQSFPEWVDKDGFIKINGNMNVITG